MAIRRPKWDQGLTQGGPSAAQGAAGGLQLFQGSPIIHFLFKRSAHSAVAAKVDVIKEFKFERPVHEGGPALQLDGPKPDQEANLEAQSWLRSPTWRSKSDLGGQLGGPKLTQEATSETQARKEANLDAQRSPRTPTWRPKGSPGGRLWMQKAAQDANLERKWSKKASQREPRGSKNEAREPT